jgi:phosphomannomutase
MSACARAVLDMGLQPHHCGAIPSPALAAYGIQRGIPSLMVTGSHIPDDRNGIKFNTPDGEILKPDEEAIRAQRVSFPAQQFDSKGVLLAEFSDALGPAKNDAYQAYVDRYLAFFAPNALAGLRIGLYEHSSVARASLFDIFSGLGAEVDRLGYSEVFTPVDTEAIRAEDIQLGREWGRQGYDALVSTDGDGDRPLLSDEKGEWLRGDVAGILCARFLSAAAVVTPVSCNSALEQSKWFEHIERTKIGSPFVIAGMQKALEQGFAPVVGYEANGGFLTASDIELDGRLLPALPTRDAAIVPLTILLMARQQGRTISELLAALPQRFTASDRLKDFPTQLSQRRIGELATDKQAVEALFGEQLGRVHSLDLTDGLRIRFESGEIAHLRPSGNAPELRAYSEAVSMRRAEEINRICMDVLNGWRV